eukprot:5914369-Amphidinium_carterae.1
MPGGVLKDKGQEVQAVCLATNLHASWRKLCWRMSLLKGMGPYASVQGHLMWVQPAAQAHQEQDGLPRRQVRHLGRDAQVPEGCVAAMGNSQTA